jgi:hypothetical protein
MKWYSKITTSNWADRLKAAQQSGDWEIVSGIEGEIRKSLFGGAHVEVILDADNVGSDGQRHINTIAVFIPAYSHEADNLCERNNFLIENHLKRDVEIVKGNVEHFLTKKR